MLGDVKQIRQLIKDENRKNHTSIPGKIVSVDAGSNTCSVQPSGKYKKADGSYLDYPQIDNVPIVLMQGNSQKASITYPIKEGDGCMISFMEQQLDHWKDDQEPKTELRFDLTNAIVTPGLSRDSNPDLSEACDNDAIFIKAEQGTIRVKKDEIKIDVNGTTILVEEGKITMKGNVKIEGNLLVQGVVYSLADVQVPTHSLDAQPIPGAFPPPAI